MIKFLTFASIIAQCYASYGGGYGGGYGNNLVGGYSQQGGIIPAAVKSTWRLDVKPVQLPQEPIQPQVIEVPPLELPVKIVYNSRSSGVFVQQIHHPGEPGQAEATRSEEEPHRLTHEVIRPVIQELREIIVPYRRVVQEIQPVVEDVQTIVSRGEGRQNSIGVGGGVLPSITGGTAGSSSGGALGLVSGGLSGTLSGIYGGAGAGGSGLIGLKGSGLGGYGVKASNLGASSEHASASASSSSSGAGKKA